MESGPQSASAHSDLFIKFQQSSVPEGCVITGGGYDVIQPGVDCDIMGWREDEGDGDVNTCNVCEVGPGGGSICDVNASNVEEPGTALGSRDITRRATLEMQSSTQAHRKVSRAPSIGMHRMSVFTGFRRKSMWQKDSEKLKKEKPTYQLGPYPGGQFSFCKAKLVVDRTLQQIIPNEDEIYEPKYAVLLMKQLSNIILKRIKCYDFPRYKYVIHTVAIQKRHTNAVMATRQMWYPENDRCYHVTKQFKDFIVVISLYALYHE